MMRNLKELLDYTARSTDGEIGTVYDFYFDENAWMVRYLVVKGGDWVDNRLLLFAPQALGQPDTQEKIYPVSLSSEVIQNSPIIRTDQPVEREDEVRLREYYAWPLDWNPEDPGGLGPGSVAAYPLVELAEQMNQNAPATPPQGVIMRSVRHTIGFSIQARDGSVGEVDDFIIEDETWRILYLVASAGSWLHSRKVLVSPTWVEQVDWDKQTLNVDLKQETIKNSPEYDPSVPLERSYESRLYKYYGRDVYWRS